MQTGHHKLSKDLSEKQKNAPRKEMGLLMDKDTGTFAPPKIAILREIKPSFTPAVAYTKCFLLLTFVVKHKVWSN